jgi:hypothetical protein
MEDHQRSQVRLILEKEADHCRRNFEERREMVYASHASAGRLHSGVTVKLVLRAMEETASNLIKSSVDEVSRVARDTEAFTLISETVYEFETYLRHQVEGVARMASGARAGPVDKGSSVFREAHRLFAEQQKRLTRQLELYRFNFIHPAAPAMRTSTSAPVQKNSGGRPMARHWDEMWASIAVMLYVGDLKPGTQSDIENAMKEWFARHDLDVGDTPVRERARALWRQLQAAE